MLMERLAFKDHATAKSITEEKPDAGDYLSYVKNKQNDGSSEFCSNENFRFHLC